MIRRHIFCRKSVEISKQRVADALQLEGNYGEHAVWGILLIRFVSDPVWYFCLFWLPGYLQEQSGLTLAQVGMFGWIPFLFADLGAIGNFGMV